jgi:carbon-monoxide dehydrogenase small subunit
MSELVVNCTVNGAAWSGAVEARTSLADLLRDRHALTGTKVACGHGVCGACTVLLDGQPVRACLSLGMTAEGRAVTTVEGLDGPVADALRHAFTRRHALQCGHCTPGMLITATDIIRRGRASDEASVRRELAGNLCRCTGYQGIVAAILDAAEAVGGAREMDQGISK